MKDISFSPYGYLLNEKETINEVTHKVVDTMGLIAGYSDLGDDYNWDAEEETRELNMLMKNPASGKDMANILKMIAKKYKSTGYNDMTFSKVASFVAKYPNLYFKFGRESSPVMYVSGGSPEELEAFLKAAKATKADEIGWTNGKKGKEIRLWWD